MGVAVAAVCKKALAEPADRKDLHQDLCTDLSISTCAMPSSKYSSLIFSNPNEL